MRTRKAYYVEQIEIMDNTKRLIVGHEFRNKKYALSLLKDLNKIGSTTFFFVFRERYINC